MVGSATPAGPRGSLVHPRANLTITKTKRKRDAVPHLCFGFWGEMSLQPDTEISARVRVTTLVAVALSLALMGLGFGYLLVVAFLVARLDDDSGFSSGEADRIFALLGLCTIFGGITLGRVSDRFGRRRTLAAGYTAFSVSTLLLLTGAYPWVVPGAIGAGLLFGGLATVIAASIVDRTDLSTCGPSYAAATFAFGVLQVASPQAGGALADWRGSFTLVFVVSAAVMSTGALIALRLPPDHPSHRERPVEVEPSGQ